jgi:hypothetical protein
MGEIKLHVLDEKRPTICKRKKEIIQYLNPPNED